MGDNNPADELFAEPEPQKNQTTGTLSQSIAQAGDEASPEYHPTLDESRVAGY
ncbi:MAG: hypothetical protein JWQ04_1408 [Pedosphaera sp.]|nr:hypothetical protein [Pedosphaera sp.]